MTQYEKIVALMIRNKGKEWFYAPDFQKPDLTADLFVGYEATARMSEMLRLFPQWIDTKKVGRYRYIRFRFENLDTPTTPCEIDNVILEETKKMEGRLL